MSLNRLVRYLIGVVLAAVLLGLVLPLVGVPKSRFLPPPSVYAAANGHTRGAVAGKQNKETNDPFHVGAREYYVSYQFLAPAPAGFGVKTPGKKQIYTGTVRVDEGAFQGIAVGQSVPVKYETTAPDINGVDVPQGSRSVAGASAMFSGWLLWIAAALALGYVFMMIIERFGHKEDI